MLSTVGEHFKNLLTLSVTNNYLVERSKLDDINLEFNRTGDLTYYGYENKAGVFFLIKNESYNLTVLKS